MVTYKDGFSKLRHLKATIEHMQKLLEKAKHDMQSDFDVWYREMCLEPRGIPDISAHALSHAGKGFPKTSGTVLPGGIKLTGDKETDFNIISFYKAKEAFLAKQK
jgi:hypothetical protein